MNPFIILLVGIAIGVVIGHLIATYIFNHVEKSLTEEQVNPPHEWRRFIEANIITSFTTEHCFHCQKLIDLFDIKFRGKLHSTIFNDWMGKMWDHLDEKYIALKLSEENFATKAKAPDEKLMSVISK